MSQEVAERTSSKRYNGAHMSTKQIAKAALAGRKATFKYLHTMPVQEVVGYFVGMDDFHFLVASVIPEGDRASEDQLISTSLIHKASADIIGLASESTLDSELPAVRAGIAAIGDPFWQWCARNYTGRA